MEKNIFLLSILAFTCAELMAQNLIIKKKHLKEDCYNSIIKQSELDSVFFYSVKLNDRKNSSNTAIVNQTGSGNKITINQSGFSNFVQIQKTPDTYSIINQTGCQNSIEFLEKISIAKKKDYRNRNQNDLPLKLEFFNQKQKN